MCNDSEIATLKYKLDSQAKINANLKMSNDKLRSQLLHAKEKLRAYKSTVDVFLTIRQMQKKIDAIKAKMQ